MTCQTGVNQTGLGECYFPWGCSTLHVMLMGIHVDSFSVHLNMGISVCAVLI